MELRQLRYFIAVAEELHFRRAAERLHISQPPLSQQIRALEDELGFTLLTRTRRRVELTPAGEAFLRDARALLAELDGAVATARRIDAGQTGRLRVGFVGSALLSIVPGTVERFRASRPGVAIELRERSTVDQLRAVAAGVVDVGLVRPPIEDDGRAARARSCCASGRWRRCRRPSARVAAPGAAAPARGRAARAVPARPGAGVPRPADRGAWPAPAPTRGSSSTPPRC